MSYPQHPSPAGSAFVAPSPAVVRSQNLPYIPPQQQPIPGVGLPYAQHYQPQPGFPPHQQQHRSIAGLPRQMHSAHPSSARPQMPMAKPHSASSVMQQRVGMPRGSHPTHDPSAAFKRPKMVGDGFEAPYLLPGPSNRILLSLKSGLPSQIDWALSRLVQLTANHRDPAAREFTLDSVPGLADSLLSFVRRVHAALTGQPEDKWAAAYFEQPEDVCDVGIGAPGDGGHQGISTLQLTNNNDTSHALVRGSHSHAHGIISFNPAGVPSHAALMRRALEAALSLRNLTTHGSNARSLASMKGVHDLIRDVLTLPGTAIHSSGVDKHQPDESPSANEDGWLELEGIAELRLYFLDILETLASKVVLTRRAAGAPSTSAITTANGQNTTSDPSKPAQSKPSSGDEIFSVLISLAKHSNDRAFLLGSLRCLTTMAAVERNEAAFAEVTLPDGEQSPGLLQRCVELLPLTQDTELLEAVLDLLYQLVCIGNNAIKIAAAVNLEARPSNRKERKDMVSLPSAQAANTHATSRTAALVRFLSRNLQLGRTIWERTAPLRVPQDWVSSIPSRHFEALRRKRELEIKLANETPQERARRKKLTRKERQSLLGLQEPHRGIAWMKMVFQRNPEREVTQMEFWTAYKEEFTNNNDGVPLAQAAELIRAVSQVFPQAAAMVVPAQNGQPQRFVIKGVEVKDRDPDVLEPYRCRWATCSAPETDTPEAQKRHAKLHVEYATDGRCGWKHCTFDTKNSGFVSEEAQKRVLLSHVLTHIKLPDATADSGKASGRPEIIVDDNLRVVSGAKHPGEASQLITAKAANGARVLRGKRDSDGVETTFTLDKAGSGGGSAEVNGSGLGRRAPTNVTPSSGTVDNPGWYVFDVIRTPSAGNEENSSPQGPAFTSILILRMLTRRAASLLQKAGSKRSDQTEDEEDAAAIRGQGDERFGLPLPANFGSSDGSKRTGGAGADEQGGFAAEGQAQFGGEDDFETTESWAVDAATRLLDAVEGVEEELMHHSSQNDILTSYINDTLVELHRRPSGGEATSASVGQVDPQLV